IDQVCAANGVFTRRLMNMARDAEVRLIAFDKTAHTVTAHMQAGVNAVNRRLIRWTVRDENFVARLFDHLIASQEVIGDFLLTELRRRTKWRVVRAPNPKNADLAETMALAVHIYTALGEIMMDVPAVCIADFGQDVGIIEHNRLQNFGGGLWSTPARHISRDQDHIGLLE